MAFTQDFLWGSATSSHQVEGGCTNNNWTRFERTMGPGGLPRIAGGQSAGIACDHWNRFREDIALMKSLGLNAYRFSVEWSKIEPEPGRFDKAALDHYNEVLAALHQAGIVPMVTLHHFTNPLWFEDSGAFGAEESPVAFGRFVGKVVESLGRQVKYWCTINEPTVYAVNGYITGEFPPGFHDPRQALRVLRNLLRAHGVAYRSIKREFPESLVGIPLSIFILEPARRYSILDRCRVKLAEHLVHASVLRYISTGRYRVVIPGLVREAIRDGNGPLHDFVGLNYYTRFFLSFDGAGIAGVRTAPVPDPERVTDMGWEIFPEGMYASLQLVRKFTRKPIYVTENGIADEADTRRGPFISAHLDILDRAINDGIDVRGYFHWSLLDNFEWAHGFNKRFGLYEVNFTTQERKLRSSAGVLVRAIEGHRGEPPAPDPS
jgi:beta-glucosidase